MQHAGYARAEPTLDEIYRDPTHLVCGFGNVILCYSSAEPNDVYCERYAEATVEYAQQYASGLGMLVLIAADEPPPREAARKAIRQSYLTMSEVMKAGVLVVEGGGFEAAAKRSAITLINLTSNLPFSIKVAGDAKLGAEKIAKMLGTRLDPRLSVPLLAAAANETKLRLR